MRDAWFVRLKNEIVEIIITTKRMMITSLTMVLRSLWIVISFQEENWIKNAKKLAEEDRAKSDYRMPNAFVQGSALTVCTMIDF